MLVLAKPAGFVIAAAAGAAVPFRVRILHNNTIRTLERSLLAADTDGYADAKSGTLRMCAVRGLVKAYRDTSTSHSRYLSGRSLGGLDGAAALPAATACGEQVYRAQEGKRGVIGEPGASESLLFSLLRSGLREELRGPSLLPYGPKLIHLNYTTGSASRPGYCAGR